MLPQTTDAMAEGGIDFGVYSEQAATDHAEDKEILRRVGAAKREKEVDYRRKWSPERRYAASVIESLKFEFAMGLLLLFNFIVVGMESNETAGCVYETKDSSRCDTKEGFLVTNTVLLGVYCVEFGVKLAVYQWDIFRNNWNVFDGCIVFVSLVETIITLTGFALPSMQFLRIFRLVRLARTVRLLELFPELYFMVHGFANAVAAMWWGFMLIAVWIMAWSILSVELVNPTNQSIAHESAYCEEAFSSVYRAFLLFFQTLVAGDSWGTCILPILEDAPYFGFIFVGAMVSIQLGFTNLVLSCIVDAATKERDTESKMQARVKKTQEIEAKQALTRMFKAMDSDKTGTISLEEFVQGYESDEEMRKQMAILRIGQEDLDTVFGLIDEDNSGSLELGEFCRFIAGVAESDNKVSMMMLKTQVSAVLQKVEAIQAAMVNVAVVTGAAPVPTRSRRKSNKSRLRLAKRSFSGFTSMTGTASLTKRGTKSGLSRSASTVSKTAHSSTTGEQASMTSTAQRDEAAVKCGGENEEVTARAPLPLIPSIATGKQASTVSTTPWDDAAAKATAGAPLAVNPDIVLAVGAMPETDIANRTPQILRSSRGSSSRRIGVSDGVPKPTGDTLVVVDHVGGSSSTAPGSTYREGRALSPGCSAMSRV